MADKDLSNARDGKPNAEKARLQVHRDNTASWKKWGPYLSERQWGTVRGAYSKPLHRLAQMAER